jgi:hypothetical protein
LTFDEELTRLAKSELPLEEKQAAIAELYRRQGREVPPPITGTLNITEPKDTFRR